MCVRRLTAHVDGNKEACWHVHARGGKGDITFRLPGHILKRTLRRERDDPCERKGKEARGGDGGDASCVLGGEKNKSARGRAPTSLPGRHLNWGQRGRLQGLSASCPLLALPFLTYLPHGLLLRTGTCGTSGGAASGVVSSLKQQERRRGHHPFTHHPGGDRRRLLCCSQWQA